MSKTRVEIQSNSTGVRKWVELDYYKNVEIEDFSFYDNANELIKIAEDLYPGWTISKIPIKDTNGYKDAFGNEITKGRSGLDGLLDRGWDNCKLDLANFITRFIKGKTKKSYSKFHDKHKIKEIFKYRIPEFIFKDDKERRKFITQLFMIACSDSIGYLDGKVYSEIFTVPFEEVTNEFAEEFGEKDVKCIGFKVVIRESI